MNYSELPIYRHRDLILSALETSQAVVVESPTGSGKTTQLPVILHEAGYSKNGIIGVTQPRRIAALSVSEFIARQLGVSLPGLVGYKMRFEDRTSQETKIKIMTDGILLQEMKLDPWLSKYGFLVVDEAHERSLNIDFILGLLKRILEARRDFKVIISSATINAEVFSEYFGECPVVKIDATAYPVTLIYDPPVITDERGGLAAQEALINKIDTIIQRFISEKREGDLLVFLPGEKIIKDCMKTLSLGPAGQYLHLIPLYGRLGKEEQERVFDVPPRGKTKVVVSTNIAETSVTIDGITGVIDSGLSKLNYYSPRTFTSSLVEAPISKASANQRKGRAGRTREGSCYRLYNRKDFENRPLFTTEEIFRTDLSEVVLRMAELGLSNFEEFDFISPPGREGLLAAIETLNLLEALEEDRSLSKTGKLMTEFPLAPRQSRIIVESILQYPQVLRETLIAAAFLSTQSPYVLPPGEEMDARRAHHGFRDNRGDLVSYLKLFKNYGDAPSKARFCERNYLDERAMGEIANVVVQLEEIVSALKVPILSGGDPDDYLCCVARGMIQFVCIREGRETYRSLTTGRISIHPGSVMFKSDPQYIVAGEIVRTTRTYAMSVSPLSKEILGRLSPDIFAAFGTENRERSPHAGAEKLKSLRDFTHSIKIRDEVFEIETVKGKKEVRLPWEKLRRIREDLPKENYYKGLKGTIIVDGKYTLLAGEKLSLILSLAPLLDVDGALKRPWTGKATFNSRDGLMILLEELPKLVSPVLWKQKGGGGNKIKRSGKNSGGKAAHDTGRPAEGGVLGFICLFTDGEGNYWFKCSRGFHTSLNESLASLEILIDELGEDVAVEKKHILNQVYRRLSDYLEKNQ
jgi:HrpA-like RNA helicase